MRYTDNYELKKPEASDFYNVDDFNYNAEKIDSELKSHAEHISEVSTTVEDLATKVGSGELQTTEQKIIPAINEVAAVAKGKNRARVFSTTESMNAWLSDSANAGVANVGDNLYIVDVGVPDWWIAEVLTEPNESGYYYEIGRLETQKVDLTTYDERIQQNADDIEGVISDLENKVTKNSECVIGPIHLNSATTSLIYDNGDGKLSFRFTTSTGGTGYSSVRDLVEAVSARGSYINLASLYSSSDDVTLSQVCSSLSDYKELAIMLKYGGLRVDAKMIPRALFVDQMISDVTGILLKSGNSDSAAQVWWDGSNICAYIDTAYYVVEVYGIK